MANKYHKAETVFKLPPAVIDVVAEAVKTAEVVILVTGVFDVLHQEHVNFLEKAKALGGKLIVGVESDARTREIKGPNRPVNHESERWANLKALKIADVVFVLPEAFNQPAHYRGLLASLKPKYLAVSSHTAYRDVKHRMMQEFGGEVVVVHDHNPQVSTTLILKKQGRET